jgi:hypothetical protein
VFLLLLHLRRLLASEHQAEIAQKALCCLLGLPGGLAVITSGRALTAPKKKPSPRRQKMEAWCKRALELTIS